MKLYHVVQWGNPSEGANGDDAQCMVAASSFTDAVAISEKHFQEWNTALGSPDYMRGRVQVVHLMGENDLPDGEAVMILYRWLNASTNPGKMRYWVRDFKQDSWTEFKD